MRFSIHALTGTFSIGSNLNISPSAFLSPDTADALSQSGFNSLPQNMITPNIGRSSTDATLTREVRLISRVTRNQLSH